VRYLVVRHSGAIEWLSQQGLVVDEHIVHLNIDDIKQGDEVVGILPIKMIAKLCAKQAKYFHLDISVPAELRGVELSAKLLDELGAKLTPYHVIEL